ncbi:MAG: hypothetical protein HLX50_01605 [Alteromonadaceae bacterium]|nr:hypothetical protein [Alteromonadaceae bacterium]
MACFESGNDRGELYIIGVGVGDPDNLTLKALNVLQRADLVLAMPFMHERLRAFIQRGIEIVDSGHGLFRPLALKSAHASVIRRQEELVRHLIRQAVVDKKQCVVVADLGDPTLFSPQAGYLAEFNDLNPMVLPGISSFSAASARLGQSLLGDSGSTLLMTHASEVEHLRGPAPDVLVLFTMGLDISALDQHLKRLYPPDTALSLVFEAGFSQKEQVTHCALDDFAATAQTLDIPWACLIFVGEIHAR